jgi:hypothetical protein
MLAHCQPVEAAHEVHHVVDRGRAEHWASGLAVPLIADACVAEPAEPAGVTTNSLLLLIHRITAEKWANGHGRTKRA